MPAQKWNDERLDKLAELVERTSQIAEKNSLAIDKLTADITAQREESKEQGIKFKYYQQATQWVVALAFSLIATATLTTIISVVIKK